MWWRRRRLGRRDALLLSLTFVVIGSPPAQLRALQPAANRGGSAETRPVRADLVAAAKGASGSKASWRDIAVAMRASLQQQPVRTIGRVDGEGGDVFGRITQAAVEPSGELYLIDALFLDVRHFGADGTYQGTAGRRGAGPGEFRAPMALQVDDQRLLHVLDRRSRRISTFRPAADGFTHVRDVPARSGYNFCALDDSTYYLVSPTANPVVRVMKPGSEPKPAFGKPIGYVDPRLFPDSATAASYRSEQDDALLYCDARREMVVLVHNMVPVVRAFTLSGQLLWQTRLRNYHQARTVPVTGRPGWYAQAGDPKTRSFHSAYSVFPLTDSVIAISLSDEPEVRRGGARHEVRLISLRDGRELESISSPHRVLGISARQLFTYAELPFPRILVYDLEAAARRR